MPKGFPNGFGKPKSAAVPRSLRGRLPGPLGAALLHGALVLFLLQFHAIREVFGQRAAAEAEWVWLPEVAWLAASPEPPPPSPAPEPPPEPLPEEIPPLPIPEPESEPEPIEEPEPEPMPPPPPVAADVAATTNRPDAWTDVRSGIVESLRYPSTARRSGTEGTVWLRLELDGAGDVVALDVLPPRPDRSLCAAAQAAVRRAGPFPDAGAAIRRGDVPPAAEIAIRFELREGEP